MAQNVRGQTLIDAIVQVFHDAPAGRALRAEDVARRLREQGFWGGKEPKAAEQVVASHLASRHAGMFEPTPDGAFALRPPYYRPAARSAAVAAAMLGAARRAEVPTGRAAMGAKAPEVVAAKVAPLTATPAAGTRIARRKKRKSFGRANIAGFVPPEIAQHPTLRKFEVHLDLEEALKLHLGLGQLLAKLSERHPRDGARRTVAAIRVHLANHRVSLHARPRKRRDGREGDVAPSPANRGVEIP